MPCPCSAESGIGSPRPSRWNSSASESRRGSSSLFAITSTSRRDERRISASSSSPGVTPAFASTTKRTRSASSTACRAWAATCGPNGPVSSRSTPPVSIRRNVVPDHSHVELLAVPRNARRLVDDRGASLGEPVDERRLPDIGKADDGNRSGDLDRFDRALVVGGPPGRSSSRPGHRGGVASRGRPSSWISTSHCQSSCSLRSTSSDASL